ncbi:unnamed protein product, partial [marine sediment metagenome]
LQPEKTTQGALKLMYELGEYLKKIVNLEAITLQPAAGAQGEFSAISMFKAYFNKKNENRKYILVPDSAHGTNPASVNFSGFKPVTLPSNDKGLVDIDKLKELMTDEVAGLMLTNPNTLGLFEKSVKLITEIVLRRKRMKLKDPKRILATDCGSTTTKAILIEKKGEEYRLVVRGEAPTTVEAPFEDVTKGVLNAVMEVEELSGTKLLDGENIIKGVKDKEGVDLYVSTSSAGGGLQMMVAGVVLTMTAESAARAALGAGAIVMDVIASNDGRLPHEKIQRIRNLRPDMILLSGGIDGGTVSHVVELAELIKAADPQPRFGVGYELPVIYAGNKDARDIILKTLKENTALVIVENLRPVLERENLSPARNKIHDQFMEHVMAHAPGYKDLMKKTDVPIMPTPGAVGLLVEIVAKKEKIDAIGVDIGGATTDVFSVFQGIFNRTVSANLGMSYSISNVLAETGIENIMRWLPEDIDERSLRN